MYMSSHSLLTSRSNFFFVLLPIVFPMLLILHSAKEKSSNSQFRQTNRLSSRVQQILRLVNFVCCSRKLGQWQGCCWRLNTKRTHTHTNIHIQIGSARCLSNIGCLLLLLSLHTFGNCTFCGYCTPTNFMPPPLLLGQSCSSVCYCTI